MATPLRRPASYEDVLAAPESFVAEVIDGTLHTNPRPSSRHARASSVLGSELTGPFDLGRGGPGGWWIVDEPELHLVPDILVPDLAGWRREHMPVYPDAPYFTLAPDWVCEVVSPGTERLDRTRKLPAYARAGVSHAWLVNPLARTLEILRLEQGHWLLLATHAENETVHAEPFETMALDLDALWSPPGSE